MATLSHEAFRRAVERFGGCDEYFTEMINAPSLINMGPFEKYYLLNGPAPEKIVWQLTGSTGAPLAEAAAIVARTGGIGVDINMGCSAPQIYKTGAGIAWMTKPLEETRSAVRGVRQALDECARETGRPLRLSVKCRLGDEDYTDDGFFTFTDMLVSEGVSLITLHARTKKEKFRTHPRYDYAEKLALRYQKERVEIAVNGDITDAEAAAHAMKAAPHASSLMIARMAAQKPWIFDELSSRWSSEDAGTAYTADHRFDAEQLAMSFVDDVEACQPKEFHRTRIQRFFAYYCKNFMFGHYFLTQVQNYHSNEETREKIHDYFVKQPDEKILSY